MARAQGARAQMALAFETTYGTPPVGGFTKMPFASTSLGAEQPLLNSELLGYGRDPLAPIKDAVTADGDGNTFFDGLSVDNATGIVDQPRLPRFKAYTNYDNYVGVGTWTKIGLNNTDYDDQGVPPLSIQASLRDVYPGEWIVGSRVSRSCSGVQVVLTRWLDPRSKRVLTLVYGGGGDGSFSKRLLVLVKGCVVTWR